MVTISLIKKCSLSFELFSYCDTEIHKASRSLVVPIRYYKKILCVARGAAARTQQNFDNALFVNLCEYGLIHRCIRTTQRRI